MNDESLVNDDHIMINSSSSQGNEDVNDIRPKNQGQGDTVTSHHKYTDVTLILNHTTKDH